MAYSNGRIPDSALARIPGSGPGGGPRLRKDCAALYNALDAKARARWNISMALHEGAVGQAYRSYARQVLAKQTYGSNAATPGTSNHGLGINVDLETQQQRWVIDQIGAVYGFSKKWSDAAWEWWHITCRPERATVHPDPPFVVLRQRSQGSRVEWVQRRLRGKGFLSVKVTGFFGEATASAVKRFQKAHGLTADGVVGRSTWRALGR